MTFVLKHAVRENVPLLIGLAGGTGSGKTLSALLLAKGLSAGRKFAVIDTESGRAKAYADDFDFDHGEIVAPFRPQTYVDAIQVCDKAGYPVIVVDSASHEYAGDGGILDWQEEELNAMVKRAKDGGDNRSEWQLQEANKMRSWIKPKMGHKAMVTRLLQVHAHLILCFRAEGKMEMAKENGKTVIREKQGLTGLNGWFPITEKNLPYELTASFLLLADAPGVPNPIKLMAKHRPFFPNGKPIGEEAGVQLAAWAKGGAPAQAATTQSHGLQPGQEPVCNECSKAAGKDVQMIFKPAGETDSGKKHDAFWMCPTGKVSGHPPMKHSTVLDKLRAVPA